VIRIWTAALAALVIGICSTYWLTTYVVLNEFVALRAAFHFERLFYCQPPQREID